MRKPDGKIVLLGDMNVGKTSLLHRYMERRFPDTVSTVGGAFYLKQWRSFNISIWDTAGEDRRRSARLSQALRGGPETRGFQPEEEAPGQVGEGGHLGVWPPLVPSPLPLVPPCWVGKLCLYSHSVRLGDNPD
jgi:hypothetical protein